jgi:hypothetical protein
MIIRFLISVFLIGYMSIGAAAQDADVDPAIQSRLDSFIEYSNGQQWEKAFNLIYPKLFTQVSRAALIDKMNQELVGLDFKMRNTRILSSSIPLREGDETFVRVNYTSDMTVKIEPGGMYDAPKAIQAIGDQFKSTYGGRSVQWDEAQKQFTILVNKNMMAIQLADGDWKLVEINPEQPELMEFLFPPAIMDKLVREE